MLADLTVKVSFFTLGFTYPVDPPGSAVRHCNSLLMGHFVIFAAYASHNWSWQSLAKSAPHCLSLATLIWLASDLAPRFSGYASGDLDKDAESIRMFADLGFEMLICQSFAKIMGLYCERIGNMCFVGKTAEIAHKCLSQVRIFMLQKNARHLYIGGYS